MYGLTNEVWLEVVIEHILVVIVKCFPCGLSFPPVVSVAEVRCPFAVSVEENITTFAKIISTSKSMFVSFLHYHITKYCYVPEHQ